jgi:hypothetical protein
MLEHNLPEDKMDTAQSEIFDAGAQPWNQASRLLRIGSRRENQPEKTEQLQPPQPWNQASRLLRIGSRREDQPEKTEQLQPPQRVRRRAKLRAFWQTARALFQR